MRDISDLMDQFKKYLADFRERYTLQQVFSMCSWLLLGIQFVAIMIITDSDLLTVATHIILLLTLLLGFVECIFERKTTKYFGIWVVLFIIYGVFVVDTGIKLADAWASVFPFVKN